MGLIEWVKAALVSPAPKNRPADGSEGACWCDDCAVRIRDAGLEGEPVCPDCDTEMRFERSAGRNCAC